MRKIINSKIWFIVAALIFGWTALAVRGGLDPLPAFAGFAAAAFVFYFPYWGDGFDNASGPVMILGLLNMGVLFISVLGLALAILLKIGVGVLGAGVDSFTPWWHHQFASS
jgi:hypothetical protein